MQVVRHQTRRIPERGATEARHLVRAARLVAQPESADALEGGYLDLVDQLTLVIDARELSRRPLGVHLGEQLEHCWLIVQVVAVGVGRGSGSDKLAPAEPPRWLRALLLLLLESSPLELPDEERIHRGVRQPQRLKQRLQLLRRHRGREQPAQ